MRLTFLIFLLSGVSFLGCADTPEFVVNRVDANHISWDTLTVSSIFEDRASIGSSKLVVPEGTRTTVFNAAYDTLYSGSEDTIAVSDVDLGDREPILIEVCGVHTGRTACGQQTVTASPKRMIPTTSLDFPQTEAYDRGTFRFDYDLSRQVFGSDEWERISRRIRPETYLMAYVESNPADAVKVPVRRTRNRFNLSRLAKYRDFRYQIKSQLMDSDSASVSFDLYVRLGLEPERIASNQVTVRAKSTEQRQAELYELVELAGGQILDRLKSVFGLRRAYVFVNEWSYQPLDRIYSAEIELHWQSGLRSEWYDMIGNLTVRSNGTAAQYEWLQGSSSAARRWVSQMDSTVIFLESLKPNSELRPPLEEED